MTGPERAGEKSCGMVALLGAPNAGKSTLMNRLVGAKISIVTPKVQTTRSRIRGVALVGACQLVLVDTPGIFRPKRRLERAMVAAAWAGARGVDVVALLFDATRQRIDGDTRLILDGLKAEGAAAARPLLVLNKIDKVRREKLLALAQAFDEEKLFDRIFMVSALTGDGIEDLKAYLAGRMRPGPWLYPEDQLSDLPERLLAAELTREQLFLRLHQELPYALTVETESWEPHDDGSVVVRQLIFVQRPQHKQICLGKGGRQIKAVREAAQKELAAILGRKVHLFLFVKVRERWLDDPERYRTWGLEYNA